MKINEGKISGLMPIFAKDIAKRLVFCTEKSDPKAIKLFWMESTAINKVYPITDVKFSGYNAKIYFNGENSVKFAANDMKNSDAITLADFISAAKKAKINKFLEIEKVIPVDQDGDEYEAKWIYGGEEDLVFSDDAE